MNAGCPVCGAEVVGETRSSCLYKCGTLYLGETPRQTELCTANARIRELEQQLSAAEQRAKNAEAIVDRINEYINGLESSGDIIAGPRTAGMAEAKAGIISGVRWAANAEAAREARQ